MMLHSCERSCYLKRNNPARRHLPKDEIICLREGHVVERGTSKELMELRGYYYTLVEKQAAPCAKELPTVCWVCLLSRNPPKKEVGVNLKGQQKENLNFVGKKKKTPFDFAFGPWQCQFLAPDCPLR